MSANERFWVADCKNLTLTTHYLQSFDPNKRCMRHKRDHTADHRKCTEVEAILCQVPSSGTCDVVGVIDSEVLSVTPGITGCESLCRNDPKCWAAIQYVPNNCVQLAVPGHGVEGFTMKSKFCFNVTLNETSVDDDQSNNDDIPNASCGNFSIQPSSTNVSLVTSLGVPVCDTVTLTTNLTIIEMTTETTTKISIKPTTEVSTKTTTEMIHSIAIEISTKTVTAFVTATQTQNITFEQVEQVAAEIVKNLTVDVKSTSSHKRRLTSAEDKRQSSKFVGFIGVIFVAAPLALMVLTDVRKLFVDFHTYSNFRKTD
ncbi:uncharacterized protein LOC132729151 [Ruditapes philippinarum]|uniref:uncharacterized protein LOC132729151 n=1 Tax=Ruditapes philippinarum TaxID=129788 RepID=UPI00295A5BC4|nr:uncharacterized protein LOC132729151 [Ruditapes philippinarum]